MKRRLYLAPPLASGITQLTKDQLHYVQNVLRLRKGTQVEVFDGAGNVASSTIELLTRREGQIEIGTIEHHRAAQLELHLAFGIIKNQAMDRMVQKATELGVTHLQPLYTEYTQVPGSARGEQGELKRREHLSRVMISAAEQCGQNYLPTLLPTVDFKTYLQQQSSQHWLVLDATGAPFPKTLPPTKATEHYELLCGPEGGWSPTELDQFEARGIAKHSLGDLILRAETAPLAGLVALQMALRTN